MDPIRRATDGSAAAGRLGGESVPPILQVDRLTAGYGPIDAVRDVTLEVREGEAVCLIGANGAGKSTTMKAIAGLLPPKSGDIRFRGSSIGGARPATIARSGIALVPEGREVIPSLSVQENLVVGTFAAPGRRESFERLYDLFPILAQRRRQRASTLSGGEQQMLAIARGLAGSPSLLLLDEPSMGLAPLVVSALFDRIGDIVRAGMTVLVVEQNAHMAFSIAQRAYIMASGEMVASGSTDDLRHDPRVKEAYLGASA